MSKQSRKPFKSPVHINVQDTRKNRILRPNELRETRCYKPQQAHSYPTFLSPLMSGHVSGLNSRAKPLAKIRKHKFMHEVLSAEHAEFMRALKDVRRKEFDRETKAALRIQHLWNKFAQKIHSNERAAWLRQVSIGVDIRGVLFHMLSADPRCKEWAFSAKQRREMDHQRNHFAAMQIQAAMRRKSVRNLMHKLRHHSAHEHQHSDWRSMYGSDHSIRNSSINHTFHPVGRGDGQEDHQSSIEEPVDTLKQKQETRQMSILVRNAQLREAQRKRAVMKSNMAISLALMKEKQRSRMKRRTDKLVAHIDSWAAEQAKDLTTDDINIKRLEVTDDMKEARRLDARSQRKPMRKKKQKMKPVVVSNLFGAEVLYEAYEDLPATDDEESYASSFSSSGVSALPSIEGV